MDATLSSDAATADAATDDTEAAGHGGLGGCSTFVPHLPGMSQWKN